MIKGIQNGRSPAMEILDRPGNDNSGGISIAMSSPEVSFPSFHTLIIIFVVVAEIFHWTNLLYSHISQ